MTTDALALVASQLPEIMRSDAKFFRRRPNRELRLRRAYFVEAETLQPAPEGFRWYCIVSQLRPGIRTRQFLCASRSLSTDLSDREIEMLIACRVLQ